MTLPPHIDYISRSINYESDSDKLYAGIIVDNHFFIHTFVDFLMPKPLAKM